MDKFILLLNGMSPYLLLGFLLAGLMHAFIPGKFYSKYLSGRNVKSVINAAILGIPLPLCSCGVIPTAMSLRKEGASKGAVVSFLIATPQTGVDSILATYGLMGLPFAILRPIAALVTAVFGGAVTQSLVKEECIEGLCVNNEIETNAKRPKTFYERIKDAIIYGYYTMMQDIGKWLVLGLIAAALITICLPSEWFTVFQGNTFASMILILIVAIPMYVCATGSIPIAIALMLKGLTPGAALVLLMAGPACNLASMIVVKKVLGTKTLLLYLFSITIGAILFGCMIDYLQFNGIVDFIGKLSMGSDCCHKETSLFAWICSGFLTLLLINALVIPKFRTNDNITTYKKTDNNMKTISIEGMCCNHCRMSVEKAILGVEGVKSADVSLEKKEAYIEGDASFDSIRKAVEEVGFSCSEK